MEKPAKEVSAILERVGKKVKNTAISIGNKEQQRAFRLAQIRTGIDDIMLFRNIPPRYLHCSLANFRIIDGSTGKAHAACQEYIENHQEGDGLFLHGLNGTGKTHLAVAVMRELCLKGELNWYFTKSPCLLMTIREAFKKTASSSESILIDRFVDYDYLIIDELGIEKVSDWTLQTLYLIIDGRSDRLKPTIITSNFSLQGIEDEVDPRLSSRIAGMSKELLELTCDDWRLRKNEGEASENS